MVTRAMLRAAQAAWPVLLVGVVALLAVRGPEPVAADEKPPAEELSLSGPFRHENLTIFLIHGKDRFKPTRLLTLQEALERDKAVVHETGTVNELEVENVSEDVEVFIQSGDVVKGGKQDRLISFDLLLPRKSGKVAVASCCVEQGRWQQRGEEAVARFSSSTAQLPSKLLKVHGGSYAQLGGQLGQFGGIAQMAPPPTQGSGQLGQFGQLGGGLQFGGQAQFGQGGVWAEVGEVQKKLQAKIGTKVQGQVSESSLQLTLEHPKVKEAIEKTTLTMELFRAIERRKDVVGYAFAINGKLNSVEIYGTADLFEKLWPKLLKANALEAFIEREDGKAYPDVKEDVVKAVLLDTDKAQAVEKDVSARIRVVMRETDKAVAFETRDRERDTWVHRSYMTKDEPAGRITRSRR